MMLNEYSFLLCSSDRTRLLGSPEVNDDGTLRPATEKSHGHGIEQEWL